MGVYYANTGLNDFLVIETSADIWAQALGLLCLLTSILRAMPRHLDAGELMLMRSLHNAKKTPVQIQRVLADRRQKKAHDIDIDPKLGMMLDQ